MTETAASARAEEFASQFEAAAAAFAELIESLTPEQWLTVVPNEARTVAALARHVGWGYGFEMTAFKAFVDGESYEAIGTEFLTTTNARHGAEYAEVPQAEALTYLRTEAAAAAATIRSFTDADLQKRGRYLQQFDPMTVANYIKRILIGHIRNHGASIREALNLT